MCDGLFMYPSGSSPQLFYAQGKFLNVELIKRLHIFPGQLHHCGRLHTIWYQLIIAYPGLSNFQVPFFFFKIILCVEGFTCVCVVYEWYPQKPEEGTGSPGPGVTGGYQPRVDGGDPAQVLYNSSQCSELMSHLSSPKSSAFLNEGRNCLVVITCVLEVIAVESCVLHASQSMWSVCGCLKFPFVFFSIFNSITKPFHIRKN